MRFLTRRSRSATLSTNIGSNKMILQLMIAVQVVHVAAVVVVFVLAVDVLVLMYI